jgi:hypothetical protein
MAEKSVAEKLMIKPSRRVRIINPPENNLRLIGELPEGAVLLDETAQVEDILPADIIILFANHADELSALLPGARTALAPGGMVWVAYHKGTSRIKTDINRDIIAAYANTVGMQAVAMIAIDGDWSALRLKVL